MSTTSSDYEIIRNNSYQASLKSYSSTRQHENENKANQANLQFLNNAEYSSLYRTVFNATFFRNIGFITKRAAETMISLYSDLQDICNKSANTIMCLVINERQRVSAYIRKKYKVDIDKANAQDEDVSETLKEVRMKKYIEDFEKRQLEKHVNDALIEKRISDALVKKGNALVSINNAPVSTNDAPIIRNIEEARVELEQIKLSHFDAIMRICKSDPLNHISVKIMSYIQSNKLVDN